MTLQTKWRRIMKSFKPLMFAVLTGLPLVALPAMAQNKDTNTTTTTGSVYAKPGATVPPQPVPPNQASVAGPQGADQSVGNNGGAGSK
jgi:hypothetical protein